MLLHAQQLFVPLWRCPQAPRLAFAIERQAAAQVADFGVEYGTRGYYRPEIRLKILHVGPTSNLCFVHSKPTKGFHTAHDSRQGISSLSGNLSLFCHILATTELGRTIQHAFKNKRVDTSRESCSRFKSDVVISLFPNFGNILVCQPECYNTALSRRSFQISRIIGEHLQNFIVFTSDGVFC